MKPSPILLTHDGTLSLELLSLGPQLQRPCRHLGAEAADARASRARALTPLRRLGHRPHPPSRISKAGLQLAQRARKVPASARSATAPLLRPSRPRSLSCPEHREYRRAV